MLIRGLNHTLGGYMAKEGSSNTAIVAIVVIGVIVLLGIGYYFFSGKDRTRVVERRSNVIERPARRNY